MRRIYVDENIPKAHDFFQKFGEVKTYHGRDLKSEDLSDADILIVRSITQVNRQLLENTPVKWVGTATAGVNHINQTDLIDLGVLWESAAGCNAVAVAEYVLAILFRLYAEEKLTPQDKIGVIGYGQVGQALTNKLTALSIPWIAVDPPRAAKFDDIDYAHWDNLAECSLISAHTPYTQSGLHPTHKMISASSFKGFKPNLHVINACRGEVIDEDSIIQSRTLFGDLFLDVFWNEPSPDLSWMKQSRLNTPHIAGYSYRGKLNGSAILVEKLNSFLGLNIPIHQGHFLKRSSTMTVIEFEAENPQANLIKSLISWMPSHYNPWSDSERFEKSWLDENRSFSFDQLRKNYPIRLEFGDVDLEIKTHCQSNTRTDFYKKQLHSLGFRSVKVSSL